MAILKVARLGHPILRQVAAPVPPEGIGAPEIQRLIDDLIETMIEYDGAGLAAPQVHVSQQIVVFEVESNPRYPDAESIPLTVLINPGTAGPAEIVAAAVQDNKRGELVGQRTYGVGSVMKVIPLEDGSALILSVAKYYTPSGKAFQEHAVQPTVEVEQPAEQVLTPLPNTLPAPGDAVVNKALEVLRGDEARKAA